MLTEATAFATVVQLLGLFRSERSSDENQTVDDYLEWLRRHNHDQLIELVQGNSEITRGIGALLARKTNEIDDKLGRIESLVLALSAKLPELQASIVQTVPTRALSQQAIALLEALENSGARHLISSTTRDTARTDAGIQLLIGSDSVFQPTDPRFLQDDIETLVHFDCLAVDYSGQHNTNYRITRVGSSLANTNGTT